jgi:hypothetical protein
MIDRKLVLALWVSFSILVSYQLGSSSDKEDSTKVSVPVPETKMEAAKSNSSEDTILVIHFHPTVQCSCCINVGIFSKKSLEKFYTKPYHEGRIIFQECNIDEDSVTAKRYGVTSSALGFRETFQGNEKFKEIESVWEFCEDKGKFLPDFKKEFDRFLLDNRKSEDSTVTKSKKTLR